MSWFKRHLNWTYVLSWLAICAIAIIAGILINVDSEIGIILLIVDVIMVWYVTIWTIKQKGRSLWNLLWGLLGIPLPIVVLCLKNKKRELQGITQPPSAQV